ncbi:hypothetical protein D3C73_1426780 [compost metagenome]
MQRAKAQLRLRGDDLARVLDLVVEQIIQTGNLDHRHGRREFAGGNEILAVRRRVATMRVLWHGDVAGKFGILAIGLATVDHRHFGAG